MLVDNRACRHRGIGFNCDEARALGDTRLAFHRKNWLGLGNFSLGLKANAVERVGGRWVGAADPRSEGVAIDTAGTVTTIVRRSNDLNGAHE